MSFKDPWILMFIPLALTLLVYVQRRVGKASILFSNILILKNYEHSFKSKFAYLPFILRLIIISLFIFALAGPQKLLHETIVKSEGIDIVLAIDTSRSMLAEDFELNSKRANRLAVIKDVVEGFIDQRKADKIGIIAFASKAYTVCPLTLDHAWLGENLERIEIGLIGQETAIGSAIATSINRLKQSKAKSKIIILLTDGVNNAGSIEPLEAARAAKALGIKIYTIGAGTMGLAPYPVAKFGNRVMYDSVKVEIDEETLQQIANLTGGSYYRATNTSSLREIYSIIDMLEKTEIEEFGYFDVEHLFQRFLIGALILLIIELLIANTYFLKIP